jgi:spore coat protein U-like protein
MQIRNRRLMPKLPWVVLIALAVLVTRPALAVLSCSASATPVTFGLYSPASAADLDSTGNVQVNCDGGRGLVSIQLSAGSSGDANDRRMFSGADSLRYNLYDKASRNQVWGDGTGGTQTVRFNVPPNRPVTVDATVYGRVFAGQAPAPGFYVDNIVVTVLF